MADNVEDVVKDTIFPRIEKLYEGIDDLRLAGTSLVALDELKVILGNFREEVGKNELDESTTNLLNAQYKNADFLIEKLSGFYNDFKQMKTPEFNVTIAKKHVSNLHLVFNGLCDIAKEVDRNYTKKPHLLCGNFPECSRCKMNEDNKEQ